jgi:hypothetical protein
MFFFSLYNCAVSNLIYLALNDTEVSNAVFKLCWRMPYNILLVNIPEFASRRCGKLRQPPVRNFSCCTGRFFKPVKCMKQLRKANYCLNSFLCMKGVCASKEAPLDHFYGRTSCFFASNELLSVSLFANAKLRKADCLRCHVCLSIGPPVCPFIHMKQLFSHWTDSHEMLYLRIFRKYLEKSQVSL